MKIDIEYTYDKEEIIAIVLAEHVKNQPLPAGHEWECTMNYMDEVKIEAVKTRAQPNPVAQDELQEA